MPESNNLQDAVKKFAADLAARMNTFMTDVATLEVRTFTTPAAVTKTFQGWTSRWTICCSWAAWRPQAISTATSMA